MRASQNTSSFSTVPGGLDPAPVIKPGGARFDTNGFSIGIGLPLSGTGGLTKLGGGSLTRSGSSNYSEGTVNGFTSEFVVVPEPAAPLAGVIGLAAAAWCL